MGATPTPTFPTTKPGIDWQKYLPELIGVGAQVGGQVYGATKQAGSIDKAAQIGAQTAQQQLNAILGMYGLQRGDRAPHRAVGVSALNTLQNWRPGQQNALAPVNLSQFKPNQVDLPPQLQALTTGGGGAGGNAFSPGASTNFSDIPTKGISGGGSWGGAGRGAATGAGIGGFAGPVGAGAGAVLGAAAGGLGRRASPIGMLFDTNAADKNFASEGINRVSNYTWNTLMPQVKSGQITPEQAEQQFNQIWGQWENSMREVPGMDRNVIERSIATQKQYFAPFYQQINALKGGQQGVA